MPGEIVKPCHGDRLQDMQEHAELSTATLCPFLCPINGEDSQRHCLQIFFLRLPARVPVRSGY